VDAGGQGFVLETDAEPVGAAAVMIATAYNREPVVPGWAAGDGRVVHSSGYRDAVPYRGRSVPIVGRLGVLRPNGIPLHHGGAVHPAAPGLHFTGFRNPITGALRELRFEARVIAAARRGAEDGPSAIV
jgi:hypothetical protein